MYREINALARAGKAAIALIVGIRCTDGAVIAADSSITFGGSIQPTTSDKQRKITIIGELSSWRIGLGQRFESVVKRFWGSDGSTMDDPR